MAKIRRGTYEIIGKCEEGEKFLQRMRMTFKYSWKDSLVTHKLSRRLKQISLNRTFLNGELQMTYSCMKTPMLLLFLELKKYLQLKNTAKKLGKSYPICIVYTICI